MRISVGFEDKGRKLFVSRLVVMDDDAKGL